MLQIFLRFAIDGDWETDDEWEEEEDWDMGDEFNEDFSAADYSAVGGFYPEPYCGKVTSLETACFQEPLVCKNTSLDIIR